MAKRTKAHAAGATARKSGRADGLTLDQSIIAVLIAAMDANQHVSPEEAARAQHIIGSMRRFRRRPGQAVDRLIETVRDRIDARGTPAVVEDAARTIPARLRPAALAVAIDLMMADARLERAERRFVTRLAATLKVRPDRTAEILRVMLLKNSV